MINRFFIHHIYILYIYIRYNPNLHRYDANITRSLGSPYDEDIITFYILKIIRKTKDFIHGPNREIFPYIIIAWNIIHINKVKPWQVKTVAFL